MAALNPPGWLQNAGATHTAEQMRSYISGVLSGASSSSMIPRTGVNPSLGNKLQVTQTGSPSMGVIVKSGLAWIAGSEGSNQGMYGVINDADITLTISAAHPTLPRIDLIAAKVEDSQYSGANDQCSFVVVTGTPAGSPSAPTAPNNSARLATVAVAAAASSISTANITDVRTYLAGQGGIITVLGSTERDAIAGTYDGMTIWNRTTKSLEVFTSSAWRPYGRSYSGQVSITPSTTVVNTFYSDDYFRGTQAITFPSGYFTSAPHVTATAESSVPGTVINVTVLNITTTGCDILLARFTSVATTIHWIAEQSTP